MPSLTEALAASAPDRLVGATDWCTHPADLDVPRVRGTKNPDLAAIRALSPDLVVANQEENRELDVRRLRDAGVAVWVTRIETVEESLDSMSRLFAEALGSARSRLAGRGARALGRPAPPALSGRRPDLARPLDGGRLVDLHRRPAPPGRGWSTLLAGRDGRYPTVTTAEIDDAGADVVLLPDEPYVFTADDGPEALTHPDPAGVGTAADLVRPGDGRGARDAG